MSRFLKTCVAALLAAALLGGCRPVADGITDTGRKVLRGLSGVDQGTVAVEPGSIAYLMRDGQGPTVVLLHGFASEKDSWLRFLRKMPKTYRVIALDLPGHGASSRDPEVDYSIDNIVGMVGSAVNALSDGPVHMVGTSLGGMIATLYTSRNLDQVLTLTLYAPAGVYPPDPSEFQLMLDRGENPLIATSAEEFDRLIEMVFYDPPPMMWPVGPSIRRYALARAPFHRKIWEDLWPGHPTLNEYLPDIDIPVLLVWGIEDRILDVSSTEVFAELLPQVEVVRVEKLGHATVNEQPVEMARLQAKFLRQHANGVTHGAN